MLNYNHGEVSYVVINIYIDNNPSIIFIYKKIVTAIGPNVFCCAGSHLHGNGRWTRMNSFISIRAVMNKLQLKF